jgi:hypothetical protein
MIAAACGRLAALARRLNVLARLDALEVEAFERLCALKTQETENMAQIDDLKAANSRLTDVVTKLLAVVGEMKSQRDAAVGLNADMQAKLTALEAAEDLQGVIDNTNALADQIEAELPSVV